MSNLAERNSWFEDGTPPQLPYVLEEDKTVSLTQLLFRREAIAAGLNPDCRAAFLATDREVNLYSIDVHDILRSRREERLRFEHIRDVAITNTAIAILLKGGIELYEYTLTSTGVWNSRSLLQARYTHGNCTWNPLRIAMCNVSGVERVAVAGEGAFSLLEVRLFHTQDMPRDPLREPRVVRLEPMTRGIYRVEDAGRVNSLAFCPIGRVVTATTDGNRALVWHVRASSEERGAISIRTRGPVSSRL